eukprot:15458760-Alexandrium_andersonii.AAC.1
MACFDFARQPPAAHHKKIAWAHGTARNPGVRLVRQLRDGRQRERFRLLGRPKASDGCPIRFVLGER